MEVIRTLIEPRHRKNIDWLLVIAVALLMAFSLAFIYPAAQGHKGHGFALQVFVKQIVAYGSGLVLMGYIATRDYALTARFAPVLYWVNIALLLLVRLIGQQDVDGAMTKGSARWIPLFYGFKLQPSELAKICIIITLALYLHRLGPRIRELPTFLKTLAHVGLPMLLIKMQPDLGTALVLGAIWLGMVFLAGADWRHITAVLLAGAALFGIAFKTGKGMDQYQIDRVLVLFGMVKDPKLTYHMKQGLAAIGGGQVTGEGYREGLQTGGGYVPENWTDFIFTAVAEETGFVGAVALLAIYGLLLSRTFAAMAESEDPLGRLIAGGVTTYLTFHLLVNIGMTCAILPIVGVPLPLMSYGGSAAWTNCMTLGLVLSVRMRRRTLQF